jgi:hypothetical protein
LCRRAYAITHQFILPHFTKQVQAQASKKLRVFKRKFRCKTCRVLSWTAHEHPAPNQHSIDAVFKLLDNDGKADRMIAATTLLNQRIAQITAMRTTQQPAAADPTLSDTERTHILFMNNHFKPFASIGYEYNGDDDRSEPAARGRDDILP